MPSPGVDEASGLSGLNFRVADIRKVLRLFDRLTAQDDCKRHVRAEPVKALILSLDIALGCDGGDHFSGDRGIVPT